VDANQNSTVKAYDSSKVIAHDNVTVDANDNTQVTAYGPDVQVDTHDSATVKKIASVN
jgi:hypothetical protein